jgi:hypothetical protein
LENEVLDPDPSHDNIEERIGVDVESDSDIDDATSDSDIDDDSQTDGEDSAITANLVKMLRKMNIYTVLKAKRTLDPEPTSNIKPRMYENPTDTPAKGEISLDGIPDPPRNRKQMLTHKYRDRS